MPEDRIREMRRNVIEYYDTYMTPQKVNKDLEDNQGDICTLMLYPKLIMTSEEEEKVESIRTGLEAALGQFSGKRQKV